MASADSPWRLLGALRWVAPFAVAEVVRLQVRQRAHFPNLKSYDFSYDRITASSRTANRYDFAFRGFILFLTGFLGPGITSVVPPLAVIFSAADFEKCDAFTVSFLVSS